MCQCLQKLGFCTGVAVLLNTPHEQGDPYSKDSPQCQQSCRGVPKCPPAPSAHCSAAVGHQGAGLSPRWPPSLGPEPPPRRYPLYQLGGPQLRVFRTNFFIQLVQPGMAQPEDTVQFRIPLEMTRVDLRNYLERIYQVPVAAVRTRVQHGSGRRRDHRQVRVKKPDYKVAYVQLAHGQTFRFPNLFPEKEQSPERSAHLDLQDQLVEQQRQSSDPRRGSVPAWFSL
ncbi:large ribosomal subunit protein uL23m [Trichechus manatus latirostris]|uniref:Large ribosomal subunit protein uL23m n=1 Tax=Trichechus manatus latirostris TaxID=127582 RepID=A0A2Y9E9A9_TRIMA|nr:large ribosomal subunit protein uL23m [Trichechus manatus latirostris]